MFPRSQRRGTPADLLVVGLGNPGAQFAGTLHNVGADAVVVVANRHGTAFRSEKGLAARTCTLTIADARVALALPTTYMNDSGLAVGGLVKRYGIEDPAKLIIVHDELDLAPGTVRVKVGGGLAGHNGLRSLESHLHTTDFVRIRIGVGKPPSAAQGANHVLKRPPKAVRELLDTSVEVAADAVETMARLGVDGAMQATNSLP